MAFESGSRTPNETQATDPTATRSFAWSPEDVHNAAKHQVALDKSDNRVTQAEKDTPTSVSVRSFSPKDIKDIAGEGGGGGGSIADFEPLLQQTTHLPSLQQVTHTIPNKTGTGEIKIRYYTDSIRTVDMYFDDLPATQETGGASLNTYTNLQNPHLEINSESLTVGSRWWATDSTTSNAVSTTKPSTNETLPRPKTRKQIMWRVQGWNECFYMVHSDIVGSGGSMTCTTTILYRWAG